jgi:hypothetical protein
MVYLFLLRSDMRQCCQKMLTDHSDRITLEARNLISLSFKHFIDPHRAARFIHLFLKCFDATCASDVSLM